MFSRFTKFGKDWMGFTGGLGGGKCFAKNSKFFYNFPKSEA